jgi:glycosyltransferase involved in cell wall biosynthesis
VTRRALVVSNDHVGSAMAGPGIRSYRFAEALLEDFDRVTLVVPFETDLRDERLDVVVENPWDPALMSARVERYDVVVAQRLPIPTMRALARSRTRAIYDLYAPLTLEQLALEAREQASPARAELVRLNDLTQTVTLVTGDAFVCASEKQRDFWLGALAGAGRLDHDLYRRDPSLRTLLDVVPFGLDVEPPQPGPALRGVVPGIGADDRILLWPGGIWNWFDPLTVIAAVGELARRRDDVRLYFLGVRHPNPEVEEMSMARDAVALADELGLRDRSVFFNFGWVPYAERGRYLLEADLAVSAHFDTVETRFAFRTRLLDCLWAGLPVVTTHGDAVGDLVVAAGAGRAVDYGDVAGWVEALEGLLGDDAERQHAAAAAAALRPRFEWPHAVEPLRRLARPGSPVAGAATAGVGAAAEYAWLRLRIGVRRRGVTGAAGQLARRAAAVARRERPQPPGVP